MTDHPGDLAVVSAYFNPCGYKSRVRNHEAFREYMNGAGVRHICVELVFNAQAEAELKPGADLLLIRGGDVMWQKERLAILGIYRLFAEGFNKVLVADGDIRFERDDWARLISERLNAFDCVQAFEIARCLYSEGERRLHTIFDTNASPRDTHPGSAWAYTRAFVDLVGLFERAIIGGADRLMSFVWLDLWRRAPSQWPMRLGLLRERLRGRIRETSPGLGATWIPARAPLAIQLCPRSDLEFGRARQLQGPCVLRPLRGARGL